MYQLIAGISSVSPFEQGGAFSALQACGLSMAEDSGICLDPYLLHHADGFLDPEVYIRVWRLAQIQMNSGPMARIRMPADGMCLWHGVCAHHAPGAFGAVK